MTNNNNWYNVLKKVLIVLFFPFVLLYLFIAGITKFVSKQELLKSDSKSISMNEIIDYEELME